MMKINADVTAVDNAVISPKKCDPFKCITNSFQGLSDCFSSFWTFGAPKLYKTISPDQPINDGYGDFIVFCTDAEGKRKNVDLDTYQAAMDIFKRFHPANGIKNRKDSIEIALREISPELKIQFVPRTLYEVAFLNAYLPEDSNPNQYLDLDEHEWTRSPVVLDNNTWDNGKVEYRHERLEAHVTKISHHMNDVFCKMLNEEQLKSDSLNFQEITHLFEKQSQQTMTRVDANLSWAEDLMKNKDCLLNAIALESSPESADKVIAYRGGTPRKDHAELNGECYSLSFGTSLFAGAFFDRWATVGNYVRNRPGYAYVVDPNEDSFKLFHYPQLPTTASILTEGETFHVRTKGWVTVQRIGGLHGTLSGDLKSLPHLQSELTKEQFLNTYSRLKKKVTVLA